LVSMICPFSPLVNRLNEGVNEAARSGVVVSHSQIRQHFHTLDPS
jgi:hypothetical protein